MLLLIAQSRSMRRPAFLFLAVAIGFLLGSSQNAKAQAFNEGFEDLGTILTSSDWTTTNHSSPNNPAVTGWSQCAGTQIAPAQAGTTNSCVQVNYLSVTPDLAGTINNWLIGPNRTLNNGDTISFYTRTLTGNAFGDRLQVRLSTSGASTNVGTSATDVGDFSTLLLDISPTYQFGQYPEVWTQFEITISGLSGPTSGRFAFRYFIEDGGQDGSHGYIIGVDTVTYSPAAAVPVQHVLDFNGDGRTDYAVVRNTGGGSDGQMTWCVQHTGSDVREFAPWGIASDLFVPADYDGDHKTDIAVFRAGHFYILNSSAGTFTDIAIGQAGDDARVVGDYDGDGKADAAVYRAGASAGDHSFWHFRRSSDGKMVAVEWGQNGDVPAQGDYTGDGKADYCVRRPAAGGQSVFLTREGTGGPEGDILTSSIVFGTPADRIVPGDYDGDRKTDIAIVREDNGRLAWYIVNSGDGSMSSYYWGATATDVLVQGDYDGDGRTDPAIWRPNPDPAQNYFVTLSSQDGTFIWYEWGMMGDYPAANFQVH